MPFQPCIRSESARRCGPGHALGLVELFLREAKLGEHFTRVLTEKWCMALQESLRTTGSRAVDGPRTVLASNRDIQIPG